MNFICPTITAGDPHEYRRQMEKVAPFSQRLHIDIMDGQLAPTISLPINSLWWPDNLLVDIHVMFQRPGDYLDQLIKLNPSLVIIHDEADVDTDEVTNILHENHIKAGLAILPDTLAEAILTKAKAFDHLLVFGGHLGYHGGRADLSQLTKVSQLRANYPDKEIGWDGGLNLDNCRQIAQAGANVLNVGSYIHS